MMSTGERATWLPSTTLKLGDAGDEVQKVFQYLNKFGYFPNKDLMDFPGWQPLVDRMPGDPSYYDETMEEAVRLYQRSHALPEDGTINQATIEQMAQPRCGVPDGYGYRLTEDVEPFSLRDLPFPFPLVFGVSHETADEIGMGRGPAVQALYAAFRQWEYTGHFRFPEWSGDPGNPPLVRTSWYFESHGGDFFTHPDTRVFGTNPNVTAHAVGNLKSGSPRICFDRAERWTLDDPPSGLDFISVALHEMGHVLGLGHLTDPAAVMYGTFNYGQKKRQLTPTDKEAFEKLLHG